MTSEVDEINKKVGLKIKLERVKRGLSQEKLGELSGLSKNSIGAIERGETSTTVSNLTKIAKVFGFTVSELTDITKFEI